MSSNLRTSGLPPLDDIPWGTHLCSFYETPADLKDLLVPYFVAGLEANERCVWVTSPPLTLDDAAEAMRERVEGFDRMVAEGRITIIPHDEWYLESGSFDMHRVFASWAAEVEAAVRAGFDGARVTGNTAWLDREHWDAFAEYERAIDGAVEDLPILVL
ncbi:MAG: MEDS domain-containing protein [Coriobacteriia bacterium]|nr:MEDS domain-containing protein [Coriobacteriia bacterium]